MVLKPLVDPRLMLLLANSPTSRSDLSWENLSIDNLAHLASHLPRLTAELAQRGAAAQVIPHDDVEDLSEIEPSFYDW